MAYSDPSGLQCLVPRAPTQKLGGPPVAMSDRGGGQTGNDYYVSDGKGSGTYTSTYYGSTEGCDKSDVKNIQSELNALGYTDNKNNKLAVDGAYGPCTTQAIEKFQRDYGFPVTGNLDNATFHALYQRSVWTWGAENYLRPKGYNCAADLLEHSLQAHPSDLVFSPSSLLAQEIATSAEVDDLIHAGICIAQDGYFSLSVDIRFASGDLHYALNWATITITGQQMSDGSWNIIGTVTDTYDYSWAIDEGDLFATVVNDAAAIAQGNGAIQSYHVTVYFIVVGWVP